MIETINRRLPIKRSSFGVVDGEDVSLFQLSNGNINIDISNFGSTIVSVNMPDKFGTWQNVVAGFRTPGEYSRNNAYIGATIGRCANRIAAGKFIIDLHEYSLTCNDGSNHLHGGVSGFDKKIWNVDNVDDELTLSLFSQDGEEGYPGNVKVQVRFILDELNRLFIRYKATTDKPTIINLTNHSYFNLTGFANPTILDHSLTIYSDSYTIKNFNNTPSGEIVSLANSPYDFRRPSAIGKEIDQLQNDKGYDINYVLSKTGSDSSLAAELYERNTGRILKMFTDQPGLQLYTSNYWDGSFIGQQNVPYQMHGAVALEAQAFPDAPNHPNFPGIILRPEGIYEQETIYQFLTTND